MLFTTQFTSSFVLHSPIFVSFRTALIIITQLVVSILNESRKNDFWHNFHFFLMLLCLHLSFLPDSQFRFTHSSEEPFFVMIFISMYLICHSQISFNSDLLFVWHFHDLCRSIFIIGFTMLSSRERRFNIKKIYNQ